MIDHDTPVRRVNDAMDQVLLGAFGPQPVDEVGVRIEQFDYSIAVVLETGDRQAARVLSTSESLHEAMAIQASARIIINRWLDNDIARNNL